MPLRQRVDVPPCSSLGRVHFMGIGGVSMSEIARLMAGLGLDVSGSDRDDSPVLAGLRAAGITVYVGQVATNITDDITTVVVNSAIAENNPEFAEVRRRGLPVLHRSVALASLLSGKRGVGISGTHGKTSTSGLAVAAFSSAQPSYAVGAALQTTGMGADLSDGEWFVLEADESDGSFLQYDLELVAVTNVEADHLDNWETPEHYLDGFVRYVTQPSVRCAVLNADDRGSRALITARRAAGLDLLTFGTAAGADITISDCDPGLGLGRGASCTLDFRGEGGRLDLAVPGLYNLHNAAAAYGLARLAGVSDADARAGLAEFRGTARRFQLVAEVAGVRIVDDYAHHPTEVAAVIAAARAGQQQGKLVVCFQPHLYSRTRDFALEFGRVLAEADHVVVLDVYPAREEPIPGVSGQLIVDACLASGGRCSYVPALADAPQALADLLTSDDLLLTVGAGSITMVGPQVAALLGAEGVC